MSRELVAITKLYDYLLWLGSKLSSFLKGRGRKVRLVRHDGWRDMQADVVHASCTLLSVWLSGHDSPGIVPRPKAHRLTPW